jgi:MoxR-like ATPase
MKRDRSRTDIETLLLQLLFEVAIGKVDARVLSRAGFARAAGLSRQALYKNHRDVVSVLVYLSNSRDRKPSDETLTERIKALREEKDDAAKKLKGAVQQNGELLVQIYDLRAQLKARGLSIVPSTSN